MNSKRYVLWQLMHHNLFNQYPSALLYSPSSVKRFLCSIFLTKHFTVSRSSRSFTSFSVGHIRQIKHQTKMLLNAREIKSIVELTGNGLSHYLVVTIIIPSFIHPVIFYALFLSCNLYRFQLNPPYNLLSSLFSIPWTILTTNKNRWKFLVRHWI